MPTDHTSRGFPIYASFKDRYNGEVGIVQSSLATEDCVWIQLRGDAHVDQAERAPMPLYKEWRCETCLGPATPQNVDARCVDDDCCNADGYHSRGVQREAIWAHRVGLSDTLIAPGYMAAHLSTDMAKTVIAGLQEWLAEVEG